MFATVFHCPVAAQRDSIQNVASTYFKKRKKNRRKNANDTSGHMEATTACAEDEDKQSRRFVASSPVAESAMRSGESSEPADSRTPRPVLSDAAISDLDKFLCSSRFDEKNNNSKAKPKLQFGKVTILKRVEKREQNDDEKGTAGEVTEVASGKSNPRCSEESCADIASDSTPDKESETGLVDSAKKRSAEKLKEKGLPVVPREDGTLMRVSEKTKRKKPRKPRNRNSARREIREECPTSSERNIVHVVTVDTDTPEEIGRPGEQFPQRTAKRANHVDWKRPADRAGLAGVGAACGDGGNARNSGGRSAHSRGKKTDGVNTGRNVNVGKKGDVISRDEPSAVEVSCAGLECVERIPPTETARTERNPPTDTCTVSTDTYAVSNPPTNTARTERNPPTDTCTVSTDTYAVSNPPTNTARTERNPPTDTCTVSTDTYAVSNPPTNTARTERNPPTDTCTVSTDTYAVSNPPTNTARTERNPPTDTCTVSTDTYAVSNPPTNTARTERNPPTDTCTVSTDTYAVSNPPTNTARTERNPPTDTCTVSTDTYAVSNPPTNTCTERNPPTDTCAISNSQTGTCVRDPPPGKKPHRAPPGLEGTTILFSFPLASGATTDETDVTTGNAREANAPGFEGTGTATGLPEGMLLPLIRFFLSPHVKPPSNRLT